MTEQELFERVRSAEGEEALRVLADEVTAESLAPARAVVHEWIAGRGAAADKAGTVVLEMEEVAVTPMLEEMDGGGVRWRWRLAEEVVDLLVQQRRAVLVRLDRLLQDRSALAGSAAAGKDLSRRVCDEAYVLVRRVATVDDPKRLGIRTEEEFLALGSADRDAEIRKWRRLPMWEDLLEGDLETAAPA
jgi:hypothetical protein